MLVKRLFDFTLSLVGLLFLAPLLLLVAISIKLDSSGPVFFRQARVGIHGKEFYILKFRTMVHQSSGLKITTGDDARITRVGKWLRKYKVDELPQLINVLKGEMSLVGPRPEVPEFVAYYPQETKEVVFSVLPGITDDAAIEFLDENKLLSSSNEPQKTYIEEILPQKLAFYEEYVKRRTLWYDIQLIWRTLRKIVG